MQFLRSSPSLMPVSWPGLVTSQIIVEIFALLSLLSVQLILDLFTKHSGSEPIDFPEPLPLDGYGKVSLSESVALLDALPTLFSGDGIPAHKPDIMENYDQM